MASVCPFCGLDPYEWVNVGIGSVPVAVTCCEMGWYYYDGGPERDHCGMPYEDVLRIQASMDREEKAALLRQIGYPVKKEPKNLEDYVDEIPF